jgi:hypothetical protein
MSAYQIIYGIRIMYASVTASRKTEAKSTARKTAKGERSNGVLRKISGYGSDSLARLVTADAPGGCCPVVGRKTSSDGLSRLIRTGSIQAKLKISKPNDKMEHEADQTADSVMTAPINRSPISSLVQPQSVLDRQAEEEKEAQANPLIQRQEEEEEAQAKPLIQRQEEEEEAQAKPLIQRQEEEEEAQAKPLIQRQEEEEEAQAKPLIQRQEEEEEAQAKPLIQRQEQKEEETQTKPLIQRKGEPTTQPSSDIQERLNSTKGAGHPLPESTQFFMEDRFGSDFSNVRVHTDDTAVQMSQEIGAQAFTHGRDVYFNAGKYDPGSSQGRNLLAHELTHTVQQGASPAVKRSVIRPDAVQRQADAVEEAMDLEAELAASDAEATAAVDPKPAEQAQKAAETEPPEPKEPEAPKEGKGEKGKEGAGKEKVAPKKSKGVAFVPGKKKKEDEAERGPTGQFLEQESAAVCGEAAGKAQVLAQNEQAHDDADEKLKQTESAVKPPEQEGQAQSNADQVEGLDQAQAPEPEEKQAKAKMTAEVEKAVPSSIKQLNEFKSKGKAKVVGSKVLKEVKKDTDAVQGTYNEIEKAPQPKPPEQESQELPPEEAVPETPTLDLGKDAVPQIKSKHTDLTEFDKKSDELLEKEGITNEQLEMVDEGDLAEAKKERKGLKKNVAEQPGMIQEFAQKQVDKVDKNLKQEEKTARGHMRGKRQEGLKASKDKQQKTKTALELKREAVTRQINAIYEKAKTSVTTKLNNLEKSSLKAFDAGQARATREFEDEVKRDINAFKRKRYSGFWGPAKWLKDKLLGIADFPEVLRAFEKAKSTFVVKIDQLIVDITKASQKVIKECKDELTGARKQIKVFVDSLGPELKTTGQQAMQEMKAKLAEMDKFIDKKKADLARKLCDKKDAAIKKIDEKIEKMKEEMSGLVSKLGNLLLGALLKFFKWALKKAGYNVSQLMNIINKGKAVIKKIVTDPIGFIGNIIKAVKDGIGLFVTNIKKHLISGLISWLTGAMADVPITLPTKWDLKGILHLILQILGLTWDRIRKKLVKRLGEKVIRIAETSVDILKRLITEGPMALWEMIKAKAAAIKQQVMEGIRNWAITQVVKQAIIKLLSFLNPAGAIIQAILAIYNTIMFFVENWDRIVQFVKTVFSSIADIAMGKLAAAAQAVERALAMTIPIILNFLARLIGLSGIGKAVTKIIKKIRKPIDNVVDKVIASVAKMAKKLLKKGKAAGKTIKEKGKKVIRGLVKWAQIKSPFTTNDGKKHRIFIEGMGKTAKIMVASQKEKMEAFFARTKERVNGMADGGEKKKLGTALQLGQQHYREALKETQALAVLETKEVVDKKKVAVKEKDVRKEFREVGKHVKILGLETGAPLNLTTKITPSGGAGRTPVITADPLTPIPGNTKGSPPPRGSKNVPPGWAHLVKVEKAKPHLNIFDNWLRMHLIHEHMHGPGKAFNLVPTPTKPNVDAYNQAEAPVLKKLANPEAALWYQTRVSYHSGSGAKSYLNDFPNSITIEWAEYTAVDEGKKSKSKKAGPFTVTEAEVPDLAGAAVPTSPTLKLKSLRVREFRMVAKQLTFLSEPQARRLHSAYANVPEMPSKSALRDYYRHKIAEGAVSEFMEHHIAQDWSTLLSLQGKKVDYGNGNQTIDIN